MVWVKPSFCVCGCFFDLWFLHARDVFVEVAVSELVWELWSSLDLSSSTNKAISPHSIVGFLFLSLHPAAPSPPAAPASQHHTTDITHSISHTQHHTTDITHSTSHNWHHTTDITHSISHNWHHTPNITHSISHSRHHTLESHNWHHHTLNITQLTSHNWHHTLNITQLTSHT